MQQSHILIVDDDAKILRLLKDFFLKNDFLVSIAADAQEAAGLLEEFIFDLIILDVMLPNITGLEFAQKIRETGSGMPIVMLTALFEPSDRINGLEAGASDYLTKPFEPRELLLRVRNLINNDKKNQQIQDIRYFGNNHYNLKTKEFFKKQQQIRLSTTEETLLDLLIKADGRIISRECLIQKIGVINTRSIDVQITRLRGKIEDNPKEPRYLKTIRNEGYALHI
jgi:two-component system, OmpR family, phosphate regulon response regulator OmpR